MTSLMPPPEGWIVVTVVPSPALQSLQAFRSALKTQWLAAELEELDSFVGCLRGEREIDREDKGGEGQTPATTTNSSANPSSHLNLMSTMRSSYRWSFTTSGFELLRS